MARLTLAVALVIATTIGTASLSSAQCGMTHGSGSSKANASDSQTEMSEMMDKMAVGNEKLIADFADLHAHFLKMMEMNNFDDLKKEMKKHVETMSEMHQEMVDQQAKCREMMSNIESESDKSTDAHSQHSH